MNIAEPDRRHSTRCIHCEHPVSGMSPRAVAEGMAHHAEFIHSTKNKDDDPHFEDARLTALLEQ